MLLLVLFFDLVPLTEEGFKSSIKGNQRRDTQYAPFVLLVSLRAKKCKDFSRKMACKGHQKKGQLEDFKRVGNFIHNPISCKDLKSIDNGSS